MKKKRPGIRNMVPKWKKEFAKKLARNMTRAEKLLWAKLKSKYAGVNFYKQAVVYGYILDFWCPKAKLVIEVDGPHHASRLAADAQRDENLKAKGVETLRFKTDEVESMIDRVLEKISEAVKRRKK